VAVVADSRMAIVQWTLLLVVFVAVFCEGNLMFTTPAYLGATTAENLEGTSLGGIPIPFFSTSTPSQFPVIAPRLVYFSLLSSCLLPLNSTRRSGEHCKLPILPSVKMTARCKSWRVPKIHLVPAISKVGGVGSHRLISPIRACYCFIAFAKC